MRSPILVYKSVSCGLGEVLLDQVVHRRFLSLEGSLLKTLRPIRIERHPLDSNSSCGQWVILRLVVTLFTARLMFLKLYLPQRSSCAVYGFENLRQRPAREADLLSGERRRHQIPSPTAIVLQTRELLEVSIAVANGGREHPGTGGVCPPRFQLPQMGSSSRTAAPETQCTIEESVVAFGTRSSRCAHKVISSKAIESRVTQ